MSDPDLGFHDVLLTTNAVGRRSERARVRRKKSQRGKSGLVLLVLLLIVGGACFGAWYGLRPTVMAMFAPDDWTGTGTSDVTIKVADGDTGSAIGLTLTQEGVIKSVKPFIAAWNANPNSSSISAGTYHLRLHMSAQSALALLLEPASKHVMTVVIPEGYRLTQVYAALAKKTPWKVADYQQAATKAGGWGLPVAAKGKLEGFLFPATYQFETDASAETILRTMYDKTISVLDGAGVPENDRFTVITTASMVQSEAGVASDYPKIARVIANRLKINMPLQFDTTIHYATGKFTLATSTPDLKVKSAYNTYTHQGLPVGPISNPGKDAIDAVVTPADGKWLYFVTTDPTKKITKFVNTAAEFAVINAEWHAWLAKHPGS